MYLDTNISSLPRTSSVTIKRLRSLGINNYFDLLNYYPTRYDDYQRVSKINLIQAAEVVTIKGEIVSIKNLFTRRGFKIQKAILTDDTGTIELVWYNQMYLLRTLTPGTRISVVGTAELELGHTILKPKDYEIIRNFEDETIHTARLVPVYPQEYGLSTKTIREKIFYVLKNSEDKESWEYIPSQIISQYSLIKLPQALQNIHFPGSQKDIEFARQRLGFDELFTRILASKITRQKWNHEVTKAPFLQNSKIKKSLSTWTHSLKYELTGAQKRSVDEITRDLVGTHPMNRFLQGDVGSGKTIVAAHAAYFTYLNKRQTIIMAPTEILAIQHFNTFTELFKNYPIKIVLHTRNHKTFKKNEKINKKLDIIIGTQALLTEPVMTDKLGLVVVDEQHRFGVRQRSILKSKGVNPHLLTMTATPIPRTVSLTLYSELDMSVIDEMPIGRREIKTFLVPEARRTLGYEWINKQIRENKTQVFIICPLIEASESETMQTVRAATLEYDFLKNKIFSDFSVALLHGKIKSKDKDAVMEDFKNKKHDIIVSTSVVEVGIDIPNATIMIIEGAERFGLAQLHQLRGRVGRGSVQSYCFLYTSNLEDQDKKRLKYFTNTNSGMRLAEYDLALRGPGQMYGTAQHGYDDLKIASLNDATLIHTAQSAAEKALHYLNNPKNSKLMLRLAALHPTEISHD